VQTHEKELGKRSVLLAYRIFCVFTDLFCVFSMSFSRMSVSRFRVYRSLLRTELGNRAVLSAFRFLLFYRFVLRVNRCC